jgi:hypothetical protein
MNSRMRIFDITVLALEAEGMRPAAARASGWRRAVAGCGVDAAAPPRNFAPEKSPVLPELIARVLPTTVLPSASALANLSPGAFPQGRRYCLYGLGDALFAGWESVARNIGSLSGGRETLFAPCFTNERGCATALTVEWLLGGEGRAALVSFAGCGGLAALEEVLAALRVHGELPAADLRSLPELAARYRRMGGRPIAPTKAVIGEAIFSVESGIHVDGLCKSPDLYELFPPESVGRERRIIMGKHSGKGAVMAKCAALGLPVTVDLAGRVLQRVKEESARRKTSLSDAEFIALYSTCRAGGGEKGETRHAPL